MDRESMARREGFEPPFASLCSYDLLPARSHDLFAARSHDLFAARSHDLFAARSHDLFAARSQIALGSKPERRV